MAFTVSSTADDTVMGNARVRYLRLTADGATDAVDTGLDVVIARPGVNFDAVNVCVSEALSDPSSIIRTIPPMKFFVIRETKVRTNEYNGMGPEDGPCDVEGRPEDVS